MGPAQGQLERTAGARVAPETSSFDPRTPSLDENANSREIENDIRRTRCEMDETLDALGEKLHPRHLLDDVIDYFRGPRSSSGDGTGARLRDEAIHTAGRFTRNLFHQIRENPIPSLLIGAGLVWLVNDQDEEFNDGPRGRRRTRYVPNQEPVMYSGSYVDARTGEPYDPSYGEEWRGRQHGDWSDTARHAGARTREMASGAAESAREMASQAGSAVSSAASTVGDMASRAGGTISDAASRAGHAMSDMASTTRETTGEWVHQAREGAAHLGHRVQSGTVRMGRQVRQQVRDTVDSSRETLDDAIEDYPLAVAAGCLGLGLLVGMILPRTRREDELMGERSDHLKDQARETGEDLLERGQNLVQSTKSAVMEEVDEQGLSVGNLAEKAMHVASKVAGAVSEAAKEEGLDVNTLKGKVQQVAGRVKDEVQQEVPLDKLGLTGEQTEQKEEQPVTSGQSAQPHCEC